MTNNILWTVGALLAVAVALWLLGRPARQRAVALSTQTGALPDVSDTPIESAPLPTIEGYA